MNIKDLRGKTGLSQQELSDETGISKAKIGQWEIEKGRPKHEDYTTLKRFFIEKGVWPETEESKNEEGPLYKHAYEGALREIDRLREQKEYVDFRLATMDAIIMNQAYGQVIVQYLAGILPENRDKSPEQIEAKLRADLDRVYTELKKAIGKRIP